jgi:hypothetical protein
MDAYSSECALSPWSVARDRETRVLVNSLPWRTAAEAAFKLKGKGAKRACPDLMALLLKEARRLRRRRSLTNRPRST